MAEYYTQINANPHFSLRFVSPLLKAAFQKQQTIELKNAFKLGDIVYTIGFNPKYKWLTLQWEEDGEPHRQTIGVAAYPSNIRSLSGTSVYYFICPHTRTKCRKLYKVEEGVFFSRKALRRTLYPIQMESKALRYVHYPLEEQEPYKRYGKEYYRGKLTPYGKKCQRYEQALDRKEQAYYETIGKLLNRFKH